MPTHDERIRDLTKDGAVERNELARAAGGLSRAARSARGRLWSAGLLAVVGVAAAGLGYVGVRAIRRVRARKKRRSFFEKLGISSRPPKKGTAGRKASQSLPLTLLLLLARSPAGRRGVAAITDRLIAGRGSPPASTPPAGPPESSGEPPRKKVES